MYEVFVSGCTGLLETGVLSRELLNAGQGVVKEILEIVRREIQWVRKVIFYFLPHHIAV
jgi:hypothetical protein